MASGRVDIGIIGAGRFGRYLSRQLRAARYDVRTADVRDPAPDYARDLATVCAARAVIYAVPIRALEDTIIATRAQLASDAVVMDVCSVKSIPCALLERHLPDQAIVGTHPLFGPDSAPDRCAGQRIAICLPASREADPRGELARTRALEICHRLELIPTVCTPAEHDYEAARTQFLTHFIGRGAQRCGIGRLPLSTKTHDDLMDIIDVVCNDTAELFEDMAAFNPMVARVRAEFLAALTEIDRGLSILEKKVTTRVV